MHKRFYATAMCRLMLNVQVNPKDLPVFFHSWEIYLNYLINMNRTWNKWKSLKSHGKIRLSKNKNQKLHLLLNFTIKKSYRLDKAIQITLPKYPKSVTMCWKEFKSFKKASMTNRKKYLKKNKKSWKNSKGWNKFKKSSPIKSYKKVSK